MSSFRPWHFDKKRLSAKLQTTGWGKHKFHEPNEKKKKEKKNEWREHETFSQSEGTRR